MLPFTPDQFFGIFADYNRAFWFVAVAWWLASVGVLVSVWRDPVHRSRWLTNLLGGLWVWNAVAYHAWLFTRINPAAWLFAALFGIQGLLFLRAGARGHLQYLSSAGSMRIVGVCLALYALAYPFLGIASGHAYPAAPTFGVPCPTAILSIGALLTVRGGVPLALGAIPMLWGYVGGSAAVLLAVPADYALLVAGLLLSMVMAGGRMRRSCQVQ